MGNAVRRGRPLKGHPAPSALPELIALWERASRAERGIMISSKRPNALAQHLYAARRSVGGYENLRLIEAKDGVWIVPKDSEA